jgi:hypothetical protein
MAVTFKQFKLTNGDEIVADVVDSQDDVLIIRAAMRIVETEVFEEGMSYFALRPYIAFQDTLDQLQLLNTRHIIAENTPSKYVMKHYARSVSAMSKFLKTGKKSLEEFESMTSQELDKWILDFIERETQEQEKVKEKLGENIIIFPSIDKDKLH